MPETIRGVRSRVTVGAPPATETLRHSRCDLALGPDAHPVKIDGKALGHTLRMAVVLAEAERRFADAGGAESAAYWARVWAETLLPDGRADHPDAWIAVQIGDHAWIDAAPARYARLLAAADTDAAERDEQTAFEMTFDAASAECMLAERGLYAGDDLRFSMSARPGRLLRSDALAFSANLFDLANLAGQVLRTAGVVNDEARFFDLLSRKRRLRETLRRRMRVVQRRALAAERAYKIQFAPERPALLKLAEFDELSTAEFTRVAAKMLGFDTTPRRPAAETPTLAAVEELRAAG